jgi:hypothetical protein
MRYLIFRQLLRIKEDKSMLNWIKEVVDYLKCVHRWEYVETKNNSDCDDGIQMIYICNKCKSCRKIMLK